VIYPSISSNQSVRKGDFTIRNDELCRKNWNFKHFYPGKVGGIFGQPLKSPASSPLKTCSSLAAVFGNLSGGF
jgi:hypothetical protein